MILEHSKAGRDSEYQEGGPAAEIKVWILLLTVPPSLLLFSLSSSLLSSSRSKPRYVPNFLPSLLHPN
jgi:hypothetical protein